MTSRDPDSTASGATNGSRGNGLVDLPLRPGASADLEFDPLGSAPEPGVGPAGPSPGRPSDRKRRSSSKRVLWLAAAIVAAIVVWLMFPDPPRAELSSDSLDFGTLRVGEASEEQTVSVVNRGERRLKIESLSYQPEMAGEYELVDEDCLGRKLGAGEGCEVRVRFRPQSAGDMSSLLTFHGNDRNQPGVVIAAMAVAPQLGVAPAAVSFGVVPLESEPVSQRVTLSNVGTATLEFRRIRIEGPAAGDFSRSRRCPGSTLEPGDACTFDLLFEPSVSGARQGVLIVDSDALESPSELKLDGTGLWDGPPLDPSASRLDLGEQRLGERGAPKRITFANRTGGSVSVDKATVSGTSSFALMEDGCGGRVVASGAECAITLTFLPVEDGAVSGVLTLSAEGASEEATVDLRGRGVTPKVEASASVLDFGDQRVGFESAPRTVGFRNSGTATLTFQAASMGGSDGAEFLVRSNDCVGKPLAPGKSCALGVGFGPSKAGARQAALAVRPGSGLEPVRIGLSGKGVVSALGVAPGRLDFGEVYLGRLEALTLTLTNDGSARLKFAGLRFEGDDASAFGLGKMACDLESGLGAGATCRLEVGFEPGAAGPSRAELVLAYNGPDSPARIQVAGTGTNPAPAFRISTTSLDLGSAPVGSRGEIGTVAISNPGAAWLELTSITLIGDHAADFQLVAGTCDGVSALAPNGSCTVGVRLAPGSEGPRRARIRVRHGAADGVANVALAGRGLPGSQ